MTTEAPGDAYVRCTMYDVRLQSLRALRGGAKQRRRPSYETVIGRSYKGAEADGVCLCTRYEVRRRRLAAPMYEVRCTMYDCDVRRLRRGDAEQVRTECLGAMIGRGYKATEADGVCLCTMDDVRRRRLAAPMYEVRCTMYDCRACARCADFSSHNVCRDSSGSVIMVTADCHDF